MNREESIRLLNQAVGEELFAINQYMYFHYHCDDQGFDLLAGIFKRYAIKEMIHAEKFAERILFLKGDVDMVPLGKIAKTHEVKKMLEVSRGLEKMTIDHYNEWAKICGQNADAVSKTLFEDIVKEEEEHYDEYDIQVDNLEKFGDQYLVLQALERSKNIVKGKKD